MSVLFFKKYITSPLLNLKLIQGHSEILQTIFLQLLRLRCFCLFGVTSHATGETEVFFLSLSGGTIAKVHRRSLTHQSENFFQGQQCTFHCIWLLQRGQNVRILLRDYLHVPEEIIV